MRFVSLSLSLRRCIVKSEEKREGGCQRCASCHQLSKQGHPDHHLLLPLPSIAPTQRRAVFQKKIIPAWQKWLKKGVYTYESWEAASPIKSNGVLQIGKWQAEDLRERLRLRPFEGGCKTFLIFAPERLHISAANALLKAIEEPPPSTYFFFVTQAPDRIISTLRSRLMHVHFPVREERDDLFGGGDGG